MNSRITDVELTMILAAAYVHFSSTAEVDLSELQRIIESALVKIGVEVVPEE